MGSAGDSPARSATRRPDLRRQVTSDGASAWRSDLSCFAALRL